MSRHTNSLHDLIWARRYLFFGLLTAAAVFVSNGREAARAAELIKVLNDDGAWCWFQDERALVHAGYLIVGSVANGRHQSDRKGDIDLVLHHLASGTTRRIEFHHRLQADDHNVPALLALPDGRLLAVYAKHGTESHFRYRTTSSADVPTDWGPIQNFVPSKRSRITYANLFCLGKENQRRGRLYNFYRGLDASFKPSYAYSDDQGKTWISGNVVIDVPLNFRHRPYVKYASDGDQTIHMLYTEGHPRNYDNGLYHVFYCNGYLHRSDGTRICHLRDGLSRPENGTQIFAGAADNVAWCCDLHLDDRGRPHAVYSVQKNSANFPPGQGGQDHRYHYAWWNGAKWQDNEVAYGGSRLYSGEDDYTGLICLDPDQLNHVYISTDADPRSGEPLISKADGQRHHEIFHGVTLDGGSTWKWAAITSNSLVDNLRPMVPRWDARHTALLWFRGKYHTYTDYETEVVARITAKSVDQVCP